MPPHISRRNVRCRLPVLPLAPSARLDDDTKELEVFSGWHLRTSRGAHSAVSQPPLEWNQPRTTRVCGERCSSTVGLKKGNMRWFADSMSISACGTGFRGLVLGI